MYYKRNTFEMLIPVSDLVPEARVCVPRNIIYGWNKPTGLNIYKPYTIKRVTPKKTKVVCDDGTEFLTKDVVFLMPVKEMNTENERVSLYFEMKKIIDTLHNISCQSLISSHEEMKEAVNHLNAFYDYCMKNSK